MPQSLAKVYVHIVFSTKHHEPFISKEIKDELYSYLAGILIKHNSDVIKINGIENHIHILCTLHRTISIAKILEEIKKSSSKWIKTKKDIWAKFGWQDGYGIFSVDEKSLNSMINYIENQEEHHKKISFKEELLKFLKMYNIEYDERYLWD